MNSVIHCQARQLLALHHDHMQAHLFLERTQIPYDVQDLIFAAIASVRNIDGEMVEAILEHYVCLSSFDDKMRH